MFIMDNPTQKSPERAFTLQKYLILHSQHDALQKHLNSIAPSPSSLPEQAFIPHHRNSISSSPNAAYNHVRHHHRSSTSSIASSNSSISPIMELDNSPIQPSTSSSARPRLDKRRSSLPPTLNTDIVELIEEEQKLLNINQQIKTTLTELLNCESVKGDRSYRMWVQSRLMDAEKELKVGRSIGAARRRSMDVGGGGMIAI